LETLLRKLARGLKEIGLPAVARSTNDRVALARLRSIELWRAAFARRFALGEGWCGCRELHPE